MITQPELNDSGGLWRVETALQNKSRKTGQLFFGQIRTLELRNSAHQAMSTDTIFANSHSVRAVCDS